MESLKELESLSRQKLLKMAKEIGVTGYHTLKKEELAYKILENKAEQQGYFFATGVLELFPDGYGFLRGPSYLPSDGDIYVSMSQIKRFDLRHRYINISITR